MARPRKKLVTKRKGSPYYWYDFSVNGQRFRASTGKDKEDEAIQFALAEQEQIKKGQTPNRGMSLDSAAARYWEEHAQHLKSGYSGAAVQIKNILRVMGPSILLEDINDNVIAKYVAIRRMDKPMRIKTTDPKNPLSKTRMANATINRELAVLYAILKRARELWGMKAFHPRRATHRLPEASKEVYADYDSAMKLIAAVVPHAKAPLFIDSVTGLRKGNLFGLQWEQVNLQHATLTFKGKSDRPGGKAHTVPLPPAAVKVLEQLEPDAKKRKGPVFYYGNLYVACPCVACTRIPRKLIGKRIQGVRRAFKTACKKIGLENFTLHSLRHSLASWLIKEGHSLLLVRDMLGHANVSTTMRYAHLETSVRAKAAHDVAKNIKVPESAFLNGVWHRKSLQKKGK